MTALAEMAVCIADAAGVMLSSSVRHAARLGRPIDGVIGRSWREWAPRSEHDQSERVFAAVLAGASRSLLVTGLRPDGLVTTSRLTLVHTRLTDGRPAVIGVHSTITLPYLAVPHQLPARNIADYVMSLTAELASMAKMSGLDPLAGQLEAVAGKAVEAASRARMLPLA